MQSFVLFTIISFILLLVLFCRVIFKARRGNTSIEKPIPKSSLVLLSIGDLLLPITGTAALLNEFPSELQKYIKNYTALQLSRVLLEYQTEDARRAITIASVLNQFHIPTTFKLIDLRTKELYLFLITEQDMVYVLKSDYDLITIAFNKFKFHESSVNYEYTKRYYNHLVLVGGLMLRHSTHNAYPSLENFVAVFKQHFKASQLLPSDTEIKSMITAWAALTGLPIPSSYKNNDMLTANLVCFSKRVKTKPLKLTLVRSTESKQ